MAPRWVDALLPWGLIAALALVVGAAGYGALWALKDLGGVFDYGWTLLVRLPPSFAKTMTAIVIVLVLGAGLASSLTLWETRSARRYARLEEQLRRERPDDAVTPYSGAEGEGVAFDGPAGRLLLLKPAQGVGAPRTVEVPAPDEPSHV